MHDVDNEDVPSSSTQSRLFWALTLAGFVALLLLCTVLALIASGG